MPGVGGLPGAGGVPGAPGVTPFAGAPDYQAAQAALTSALGGDATATLPDSIYQAASNPTNPDPVAAEFIKAFTAAVGTAAQQEGPFKSDVELQTEAQRFVAEEKRRSAREVEFAQSEAQREVAKMQTLSLIHI